jgi:hypothetical protein
MTHRDEIAELADRTDANLRRGEDPEFEFAIDSRALTGEEREAFMVLPVALDWDAPAAGVLLTVVSILGLAVLAHRG